MKQRPGQILVAIALLALSILALVSYSDARSIHVRRVDAESELGRRAEALKQADNRIRLLDHQIHSRFSAKFAARSLSTFRNPSADPTLDSRLVEAIEHYTEFLQQHSRDDSRSAERASAHFELGNAHRARIELNLAARHFHKAEELYEQSIGAPHDSEQKLHLGQTCSRLGWVLASKGDWPAAVKAYQKAVRTLSEVETSSSGSTETQFELALAHRNLAVIRLHSGHDRTAALDQSLEVLLRQSLEVLRPVLERLRSTNEVDESRVTGQELLRNAAFQVDTGQLLLARLWQEGKLDAAADIADENMAVLQQLLAWIDRLGEERLVEIPALKYRTALRLARNNAELLEQDRSHKDDSVGSRENSTATSNLAPRWSWRPLFDVEGLNLHHGLLESGTLHGEFEDQAALLLCWRDSLWLKKPMTEVIRNVREHIPLMILVADDELEQDARELLSDAGIPRSGIRFLHIQTDSQWVRDFGPHVIENRSGGIRYLDSKYLPLRNPFDELVPRAVARKTGHAVIPSPLSLCGGEILSNGAGLCLVSSSVREKNHLFGHDVKHVVTTLKRLTGADEIIFLDGLQGEPTQHVDRFATFTAPDTVVIGEYRDSSLANAERLNNYASILEGQATRAGPLKVVRIPMPPRRTDYFGGTYTNVVYANGVLLVPTWPDVPSGMEQEALDIYRQLLPGWKVVGIDSHALGRRNGGLHCATMNLFRAGSPFESVSR